MKSKFSLSIFFLVIFLISINLSQQNIDLDYQVNNLMKKLKGKNVAFLTNPTGVDKKLNMLIDKIYDDKSINLKCFFAPEHGLRGNQQAGANISDYTDPITGLPVYSLYGTRKAPTSEQLKGIDILVYFIQDTGTRFYTYIWTLTWTMQACAENGVKVMVFDRPNPLSADVVEGCPNNINNDYVGRIFPGQTIGIPQRYGMTIGEFAQMVNNEWMDSQLDLENIKMINYYREDYFEESGLTWIMPSPNMPTLDTCLVYPGLGIFEGSTISEGRGTTKPFEIIGGPQDIVDAYELQDYLNEQNLKSVLFRPTYFNPTFSKFQGEDCAGIEVTPIYQENFESVKTGATIMQAFLKLYPDKFQVTSFANNLFGLKDFTNMIQTMTVDEILDSCSQDMKTFKQWRQNNLIYPSRHNSQNYEIQK